MSLNNYSSTLLYLYEFDIQYQCSQTRTTDQEMVDNVCTTDYKFPHYVNRKVSSIENKSPQEISTHIQRD